MIDISEIKWPNGPKKFLTKTEDMSYESLDLLYNETKPDVFGDHMGFAVSCTKNFSEPPDRRGCIQKLEVTASPNFAHGRLEITHEVLPGQGACGQIIPVNPLLKVGCFDNGAIVPIKNFGYKRTYHCDVRSRIHHHNAPINLLASNLDGTHLASGTTSGEIGLYQVKSEDITFVSKKSISSTFITGLSFFQSSSRGPLKSSDREASNNEHLLVYSTQDGFIGLIDRRCSLASEISYGTIHETSPRWNISSLCVMRNLPGQLIYLGTLHGQVGSIDLRYPKAFVNHQDVLEDGTIRRMKEIVVNDIRGDEKVFLAYTNSTNTIQILDGTTLKRHENWTCDRLPDGVQLDLIQVDDRIVTCGNQVSIGCWKWKAEIADQESTEVNEISA